VVDLVVRVGAGPAGDGAILDRPELGIADSSAAATARTTEANVLNEKSVFMGAE
jgi:hypothetical protein